MIVSRRQGKSKTSVGTKYLVVVVVMAVVVRLMMVLLYVVPVPDFLGAWGKDAIGYQQLAVFFLQTGRLDHPLFLARPPLFPMTIALVYALAGTTTPWIPILLNLCFTATTAGLAVLLGIRLGLSRRISLLAGMVIALDPTSSYEGIAPLTEALFTLLLLLSLLSMTYVHSTHRLMTLLMAIGTGLMLGLAMLTRPIAILYWLIPVLLIGLLWRQWREALLAAVIPLTCLIGWTLHNSVTWGVPTFSTIGTYNLLYYRAVEIQRRVTGEPALVIEQRLFTEVERRLGNDVTTIPKTSKGRVDLSRHFPTTDQQRLKMIKTLAWEIYRSHPWWYVFMGLVGVFRMHFSQPFPLPWALVLGVLHLAIYITAVVGIITMWRRGQRDVVFLIGLTVLYFTAITVATITAGWARFRVPYFPLIAIAAAEGWHALPLVAAHASEGPL